MRTLLLLSLLCGGCFDFKKLEESPDGGDVGKQADGATTSVDGAPTTGDLGAPNDLTPIDLAPPPADLSCHGWVNDPVQETPCTPDQQPQINDSSAGCFIKACGCKSQATCTICFWNPWQQVACQ